jgi:hypothetical protein
MNPDYQTKKVRCFIVDLINDHDYRHYYDLCTYQKREFTALLLECSAQHAYDHEFFSETDGLMNHVRKALMSDGNASAELGEAIQDAAVAYHENTMEKLFNAELENLKQEADEWMDYVCKHGDPDAAYDRYKANIL